MMKYIPHLGLILAPLAGCANTPTPPATLSVPSDHNQVWADEFDQDGLPDPTRWAHDTQRIADGWYNDELQDYSAERPENARVS